MELQQREKLLLTMMNGSKLYNPEVVVGWSLLSTQGGNFLGIPMLFNLL
jgi:hypothetical protein